MSLISTVVADASASTAPKARSMVHVFSDNTTSIVRYEVPAGRKFVGRVVGTNNSSYFRLTKQNSDNIDIGCQGSTSVGAYLPIELLAGQTVTGYYFHIIGVESDE